MLFNLSFLESAFINPLYAAHDLCPSVFFSLLGWDHSPLSVWAIRAFIIPAPDDRRWMWSSRCNENWQGKPNYSEKTCLNATLSTTNPTWPDLDWNPDRRNGKPATNLLSYGMALIYTLIIWMKSILRTVALWTDMQHNSEIWNSQGISQERLFEMMSVSLIIYN
jgi:hypothetical protein